MSIEEIRNFCLSLPYSEETLPFDDTTLVYKVAGKMFAVTDLEHSDRVVVKCDPDLAIELRDRHEEVSAAWHFNKRHWNAISLNGDLSERFIFEQIFNSYMLVIKLNVTPVATRREIVAVVENIDVSTIYTNHNSFE